MSGDVYMVREPLEKRERIEEEGVIMGKCRCSRGQDSSKDSSLVIVGEC